MSRGPCNVSTKITVEREPEPGHFVEIEVECVFWFEPAERGSRDEYGQQMEPDYDASMTLEKSTVNGADFELTPREIEQAEEELWERHREVIAERRRR